MASRKVSGAVAPIATMNLKTFGNSLLASQKGQSRAQVAGHQFFAKNANRITTAKTPASGDQLAAAGDAAAPDVTQDMRRKLYGAVYSASAVASHREKHGSTRVNNIILRSDHFIGIDQKLSPPVEGAVNFRKVPHLNVYGVGIPTITGVGNVLRTLHAYDAAWTSQPSDGARGVLPKRKLFSLSEDNIAGRVIWVNLREEPFVYLGDETYEVSDTSLPNQNMRFTGVSTRDVEAAEAKMRKEILKVGEKQDGRVLGYKEFEGTGTAALWLPATEGNVKTARQVYDEYATKGARCTFLRIPITDESSPELGDFDQLSGELLPWIRKSVAEHADAKKSGAKNNMTTSFVFNCQMGQGRTTTGMVLCSMLIAAAYPGYFQVAPRPKFDVPTTSLALGDFKVIKDLVNKLPDGVAAKARTDAIIDACNRMQNLRTAVEAKALLAFKATTIEDRRSKEILARRFLERYFNLIAFNSALHEHAVNGKVKDFSFKKWMDSRPQLQWLLEEATLE